ncbi:MAG: hypothetical protein LBI48_12155 [Burkholderiaceae bacterium]|jgi:hypothetical protein|nr:hypothetical protein [Burkholderiaceae bacterium]
MTQPFSFLLSAITLAAAGLMSAAPAQAVGRLVDVDVIDRDSGARLPVYGHKGQWWVEGRPGARYAIAVRNATGARVLGVMSVDGVNVISGETAGWEQTGYVLSPWQSAQITGWRKSDLEVAAFNFTALPNSYAARTGRPDNVGVIGLAVFREKAPEPPPVALAPPADAAREGRSDRLAQPSARTGAAADAQMENRALGSQPAAPRLGTGHGARESAWASHTEFERRTVRPDEIVTIRYDSRANLVAMGVMTAPYRPAPRPAPFPESTDSRYVPDPD